MKKTLLSFLFILFALNGYTQSRLINKFFSADTGRRNSFMPLPAFSYSQEAGLVFGAVGLYSFYLDKNDYSNKSSQIYGVAYTSTKGQSQLGIKSELWSKGNKWHHIYTAQWYNIPFNFYGLGNNTSILDEDKIKQNRIRLNTEVERAITKKYYSGLGIEFERHSFKDVEKDGIFENNTYIGKEGGEYAFFKITQLYDGRNRNTYTSKGIYARLKFGVAPDLFGDDNFSGNLFTADIRNFTPINEKLIWGSQLFFENINSKKDIPFYVNRQMGNDEVMRGYYQGRYRDKNYIALQTELRYRFVDRFGLVAFAGAGNTYGKEDFSMNNLKPNYGIGGRFFFDLDKDIAIRFDYGFGEKPKGEKRISGFYISLSEAF